MRSSINQDLIYISTIVLAIASLSSAAMEIGYYRYTCPLAEKVIRETVAEAVHEDPGLAPAIIRMHFHDCFVRGCDASILLDSTPGNRAEKEAPPNNPSLRGYELIDKIKILLESKCRRTVSCADIIAYAARDSVYFTGGVEYEVPGGRRDGRASVEAEVLQNLPAFFFNAQMLRDNFESKGLSLDDMVTLSGAHSLGRTHCSSFTDRLYNFSNTGNQDPSMNRILASILKRRCPPSSSNPFDRRTVPLDSSPRQLDIKYYRDLMKRRGVLTSDQTLWESKLTKTMVAANVKNRAAWAVKFAEAMVRMGAIEVKVGHEGEIRKSCRLVNSY